MSKFKVGDVIRNKDNPHYEVGAIGKVIGLTDLGWVRVDLKSKTEYGERNYWAVQKWMELSPAPQKPHPLQSRTKATHTTVASVCVLRG